MSKPAKPGESASDTRAKRPPAPPSLLQNKRFVMGLSLFLAIIVWVIFAVIEGEEQERGITVPVRYSLEGTIAEDLGLQAFWLNPAFDPHDYTIEVAYRSKRYEVVTAEDFEAVFDARGVHTVGVFSLPIRVSSERFEFVDRQRSLSLYFDHYGENTFDLELAIDGDIDVPEGWYAAEPLLLTRRVKVSGPRSIVRDVDRVKAVLTIEDILTETTEFDKLEIIAENQFGDELSFLTIEDGAPEISAVIPVWRRATLQSAAAFLDIPGAYQGNGNALRYSVNPASFDAALPDAAVPESNGFIIGEIYARELSPQNNRFTFSADSLSEIHFFDDIGNFTVVVDMNGMDIIRLDLSGERVALAEGSGFAGTFGNIAGIRVVGPADAVSELTEEDISGMITAEELSAGANQRLPVAIAVNRDDCWVFGEYTAQGTLRAE